MVKTENTYVYMEGLEEAKDKGNEPHQRHGAGVVGLPSGHYYLDRNHSQLLVLLPTQEVALIHKYTRLWKTSKI